jgi:hypothetical protein
MGSRANHGGIAQLAEHELCKLGVTGSSPVASTMLRLQRSGAKHALRSLGEAGLPGLNGVCCELRMASQPLPEAKVLGQGCAGLHAG